MRRLYSAGLALYLLARLPGFLFAGLIRGKHDLATRLREGFQGPQPLGAPGETIWVHACSLGEVLAARGLIAGLRERLPGRRVLLSTITRTGYDIARGRLGELTEGVFYFPFDLRGAVRRALEAVRPCVVIIVETEIWPNFLLECYRRGIAVVWVNGRISDGAFSRYRLAAPFLSPLLAQARLFVMRTEEDARRIQQLGAPAQRVVVAGNLKYDRGSLERPALGETARRLDELLGLSGAGPLIVAGSTTEPEEAIVLEAFRIVRRRPRLGNARLLIAPRHPERFEAVAAMLEASGLRLARRSRPTRESEIVLLDSIGELAGAYALADAVFVGGSFSRRGGQSILEPAAHGRAAVVGPHMENFREVLGDFKAAGAVVQIVEEDPGAASRLLAEAWTTLLERPEEAAEMGRRARAVLERNEGATARTLAQLVPIIQTACQPAGTRDA
jgi:3-deoxy-D-manno-octulosonic-acid transferase